MDSPSATQPIKVLIIEDNPQDLQLTRRLLEKGSGGPYRISSADRLATGIGIASQGNTDIILLDLGLPDGRGLDTFIRLKSLLFEIPVVVLSGLEDQETSRQAVRQGAQDYLIKGQTKSFLLEHTIRYAIERQGAENKIIKLAYHDPLTDLGNRTLLADRSRLSLAACQRYHKKSAVMLLDVDKFKSINDTLGHEPGDQVLKELAARLKNSFRMTDTICRLGGDEFVIMISEMNDIKAAGLAAERLMETLRKPFILDGFDTRINISIGIAIYPEHGEDLPALLKVADSAMYAVKKSGGDNFRIALSNSPDPLTSPN